jgi:hypothetical protein
LGRTWNIYEYNNIRSVEDDDDGPTHLMLHRHVEREHVLETDQKKMGPPVVKTTVEGKLKMEKSVGSHLARCDHQIAKAYTVRDTTTHYRIRTIIGEKGKAKVWKITFKWNIYKLIHK